MPLGGTVNGHINHRSLGTHFRWCLHVAVAVREVEPLQLLVHGVLGVPEWVQDFHDVLHVLAVHPAVAIVEHEHIWKQEKQGRLSALKPRCLGSVNI